MPTPYTPADLALFERVNWLELHGHRHTAAALLAEWRAGK